MPTGDSNIGDSRKIWNSTFKIKKNAKPLKRTPFKSRTSPLKRRAFKRRIKPKAKRKRPNALRGVYSAKLRAWKAFARFIRQRDPACLTCGKPTTEAGHFIHNTDKPNKTLGGNMLWFCEKNVHGQEAYCNRHRGGNTSLYSLKLVEKYGDGIIQELHKLHQTAKKWTIPELEEIAAFYEMRLTQLLTQLESGIL